LIRLDGRTRFNLTNDREIGDLTQPARNILAQLFQDDALRETLRKIIFDAFGVYFVVDPTNGGQLRIRLSTDEPTHDEQSLGVAAREYHKKAAHIKDASDGVQAFVGIAMTVECGDYRLMLVDEPEAFLHPPLARKLGNQLTNTITKRGGSLLAATHSPDFLIGCLQASQNVRVLRLEYLGGRSKAQLVDSAALNRFFKTPLMRSANVVAALFHDGVVITESDNDRAFYAEVYYRLAEGEPGQPSLLFVNAQNKQTIQDIMGPLRIFGVPAAAIVDIDIIKDGGATWIGWLKAAEIPSALHGGFGQMRGDLKKKFEDAGLNMKERGVDGLPSSTDRDAANKLFDDLQDYGIFATRRGELEHWLAALGVPGKKTDWTIGMLEKMGNDPTSAGYVKPSNDDVWDFMRAIVAEESRAAGDKVATPSPPRCRVRPRSSCRLRDSRHRYAGSRLLRRGLSRTGDRARRRRHPRSTRCA
jgi:hypothetical protein